MKNWMDSFTRYVINLTISVFLSFSFTYALTTTLKMTYEAKDVFLLVCFASVIYSIAFASRLLVKISAVASVLTAAGGLFYFLIKPSVFKLVYSKTVATFLWLKSYINGEVPLSTEYQIYTLLALSIGISLAVYLFTVKKFNFYVLLIGGTSLFAVQWILDYFVSYLSFYVFVFLILVCYFKHIYLRNTAIGQSTSRQAPAVFLILSASMSALVFLFAYYMPASDKPLEWDWMDSKRTLAQGYVQSRLNIGNTEYFAISSTGFGEESSRLGGNVTLDDTRVMKVESPESGIYLKGAVREMYTGSSWKSLDSGQTTLGEKLQLDDFNNDLFEVPEGSRVGSDRNNDLNKFFNKISLNITYENLNTKTLFIPAKTQSLRFNTGPLNVALDSYGIPSSTNSLGKEFNYTVGLYSIKKDSESLAQLLRSSSGRENSSRYLQLPAELPERVRKLALEITSSSKNDYDRVKAIESYLATNYRYTLEPGTTPRDRDFVDYFLFDLKQGYCTYYASAMTVLTRSIGLPARYVEGYVLPSQPVEGTTYEVTNNQAHAWVEVYFEDFGWIPFEPTSSFSQNFYGTLEETLSEENNTLAQTNTEETPGTENNTPDDPNIEQNEPAKELTASPDASAASLESSGIGNGIGAQILPFLKLAVPFLVLLLWAAAFSPLRRTLRLQRLQRLTPRQGILEMYRHFLRAFSVQGLPIMPGETPLQYAHRLDVSLGFNTLSFKTVTETFIKARYSNMSIDEKEMQLVIDFYSIFSAQCKERSGWLRYFIYNNLLGLI